MPQSHNEQRQRDHKPEQEHPDVVKEEELRVAGGDDYRRIGRAEADQQAVQRAEPVQTGVLPQRGQDPISLLDVG